MRIQIIVQADVSEDVDAQGLFKKLDVMFRHEHLTAALGFSGEVTEISEVPDPDSRTQQLRDVAEALARVGFDELPAGIVVAQGDEGEPLEVRLSLSISRTDFPSVSLDELLEALEGFDDDELAIMGPAGVIALFDSFAKAEDEIDPHAEAAAAAQAVDQATGLSEEAESPTRTQPTDHESELDQAEAALKETLQ